MHRLQELRRDVLHGFLLQSHYYYYESTRKKEKSFCIYCFLLLRTWPKARGSDRRKVRDRWDALINQFRHEVVLRGADLGDLFHGCIPILTRVSFFCFGCRGVAGGVAVFATLSLFRGVTNLFSAPIFCLYSLSFSFLLSLLIRDIDFNLRISRALI